MDQAAPKTKGNWGQGLIPLYTRNPACPLLLGVPQTVSLLGTRTPSLFVSVLPLPTPSDPFLPLASSLYGIHRVSYHHFSVREHSLSFLSTRRRPFLPVSKESNAPRATRGSVILLIKQSNTGTVNPYRSPIPPRMLELATPSKSLIELDQLLSKVSNSIVRSRRKDAENILTSKSKL